MFVVLQIAAGVFVAGILLRFVDGLVAAEESNALTKAMYPGLGRSVAVLIILAFAVLIWVFGRSAP